MKMPRRPWYSAAEPAAGYIWAASCDPAGCLSFPKIASEPDLVAILHALEMSSGLHHQYVRI
jgi:hypothetical protein